MVTMRPPTPRDDANDEVGRPGRIINRSDGFIVLTAFGTALDKASIISFLLDGYRPEVVGSP